MVVLRIDVCVRLARIMTLESGKPLRESLAEVGYGTSFIDFYAAEAMRSNSAGGGYLYPSPFSSIDGSPRCVCQSILLKTIFAFR